jgi:hypothetical protein
MKGIEGALRAFDDRLLSFHKIQNVYRALRIVRYSLGKPVTPRFNELQFVKTGALLAPSVPGGDRLD